MIVKMNVLAYEKARLLIGEYIYFYNSERITLKHGLTPNEIRSKAA